jgi:hypothetical protein
MGKKIWTAPIDLSLHRSTSCLFRKEDAELYHHHDRRRKIHRAMNRKIWVTPIDKSLLRSANYLFREEEARIIKEKEESHRAIYRKKMGRSH